MSAWRARFMCEHTAGVTVATSKSIGGEPPAEELASANGSIQQQNNSPSLKTTKPQVDASRKIYVRKIIPIVSTVPNYIFSEKRYDLLFP